MSEISNFFFMKMTCYQIINISDNNLNLYMHISLYMSIKLSHTIVNNISDLLGSYS